MNYDENKILGTVETIAGGFARGNPSHNTQKWHMWTVMAVEAKRRKERYEPIYFTEKEFGNIENVRPTFCTPM